MADLMRTSNPALNDKAFKGQVAYGEAMTMQGTVNKTGLLLLCVVATAAWTWGLSHSAAPGAAIPWMMGGLFGGFIVALVTIFKQNWAPITAPIYALLEGLALGGISAMFERTYPGVAMQAVGLTFGTLFVGDDSWWFLSHSGSGDQRQRPCGNRLQPLCGHHRGAKSSARF